jgi:hypothetical protein
VLTPVVLLEYRYLSMDVHFDARSEIDHRVQDLLKELIR